MKARILPALAALALALGGAATVAQVGLTAAPGGSSAAQDGPALAPEEGQAVATFAGGCFWCMEPPYDELDGVLATISGYSGGTTVDPTYQEVVRGGTGHAEVVQITYDPAKVTYEQLLEVFWRNVDPLDVGGQFCDRGDSYRTGIFVHDEAQRRLAEQSRQALADSGRFDRPIVTEITEVGAFYPAEDYHQEYYEKNPIRYKYYRWNCGRDQRLEQLWGQPPSH